MYGAYIKPDIRLETLVSPVTTCLCLVDSSSFRRVWDEIAETSPRRHFRFICEKSPSAVTSRAYHLLCFIFTGFKEEVSTYEYTFCDFREILYISRTPWST